MKRSPITRKTRLNSVNPARKAKRFEANYGGADYVAHIKAMPCAICGVVGYSEAAHVRSRGAGGDASDIVPLCGIRPASGFYTGYEGCHRRLDEAHRRYLPAKPRLRALAKSLRRAWLAEQEEE